MPKRRGCRRLADAGALIAKLRTLVAWAGLPAAEADTAIALTVDGDNDVPAAALRALLERWTV